MPSNKGRRSHEIPSVEGGEIYPSVFSIVFIPTLSCNCKCLHCFEKLDNRHITHDIWEILFLKMRKLAETINCQTLRLYWQGGEVLCLDPDSVQKGLSTAAAVFHDSGITLEHHLQTNLLLYESSKWKDILSSFSLATISSSLDFPNLYRKAQSISTKEYFQLWYRKKEVAERDGFEVSVVSLPNPETLRLGAKKFYQFFKEEVRATNIQINFPFPGGNGGPHALNLDDLSHFMRELYGVWLSSGRDLNLSPFKSLEERLLWNKGTLLCSWAYTCAKSLLAIGPNGEIGQCDCWITTFKDFNYGSLFEHTPNALLNSAQRQFFLERPLRLIRDSKCGECKFWKICHGGCPVRAYTFSGDLFSPDHYCPVYYSMFSTILENAIEHEHPIA
jgi:uncharacterized protein